VRAISYFRQQHPLLSLTATQTRSAPSPHIHVARSPWRSILTHSSVATQGTIEFHNNRKLRRAARASGGVWVNPYDLGPAANWQVRRSSMAKFLLVTLLHGCEMSHLPRWVVAFLHIYEHSCSKLCCVACNDSVGECRRRLECAACYGGCAGCCRRSAIRGAAGCIAWRTLLSARSMLPSQEHSICRGVRTRH